MIIRSLALTTELALAGTRGKITDRGDYLVVETPDDPGYYHGNVLALRAAPQVGEVAYWTRKFAAELGHNPEIRHVTLWWDGVRGDVGAADELRAAGFNITVSPVMVAEEVLAPPTQFEVRQMTAQEVLVGTADIAWALADRHDDAYRRFFQRRAAWHRGLVVRGAATFWGAFDHGTLVGSLGLVPLGNVARYQDVQTVATHRRRGIASALLAASARHALGEQGIERVVVIAEAASGADRVYTRAGFRTIEQTASAVKPPS